MTSPSRTRVERIELRTTTDVRQLVDRVAEASGTTLTAFAETHLVLAARRVLADRVRFRLSERTRAEWDAINDRPAHDLPGLRALLDRPSPFGA